MKKALRKNRRNLRPGFSLIELLLVVTLSAGFLTLTAVWMQQTLKFSKTVKQRQRVHGNLTRLAWDLRDSVRQASAIAMDGNDKLVLTLEDGQTASFAIISSQAPARLKIEKIFTKSTQGEPATVRETFELKPNSVAMWETSEMPQWISLTIARGQEGVANGKTENGDSTMKPQSDADAKASGVLELHVRTGPNPKPLAKPLPKQSPESTGDNAEVEKSTPEENQ